MFKVELYNGYTIFEKNKLHFITFIYIILLNISFLHTRNDIILCKPTFSDERACCDELLARHEHIEKILTSQILFVHFSKTEKLMSSNRFWDNLELKSLQKKEQNTEIMALFEKNKIVLVCLIIKV
ncbi:hypothetical protein BpHYR1_020264 [Brachionus plicatilis]|uniref:Uncharacterized protein n=1 Tax=Brachionus plicatilis TaxID=10195 RepID=A0A3M7QJP5_BRAPC|nr:hypothetical protein BpHYR1_020264 [Brachionus plicatilis]